MTILTDDLPVVQQKVGIDLRGGKADYVLNYVQDKPIGAPFGEFYADMTPLFGDAILPQDADGYGDEAWFDNFLSACGRFYDREKIIALPYDCAVACTLPTVNESGRSRELVSSSHRNGVATDAFGRARTAYGGTAVCA